MPKRPTVIVGYTYYGDVDTEFMHCMERLRAYDTLYSGYLPDAWAIKHGGTNIPFQRNEIVRRFLETDADWLLFLDTDETFDPDLIDRLMATADPETRPVVSGLVMAYRPGRMVPVTPACAVLNEAGNLAPPLLIPAGNPWEVAAVGAGCLLVHRSVYERVLEDYPDTAFPWFTTTTWRREKPDGSVELDCMGEDYVFSLRAGSAGFPILVDTDVVCGHRKVYEFGPADYWRQVPFDVIEPRTYVIIPVKDQRTLTESLLRQLASQGGYHGVIVLDNGSAKETRRYLERQTIAEVVPAHGLGIHEMWNLGARIALKRWPKCDLAFLNNDLNLGPDFLASLSSELRARDDLAAVSPVYDGRELDGLYDCNEICANRYDGTGGAPGFAFMARGELFSAGYQFPEDCRWWFGDNDLLLTIRAAGMAWALTPKATVEHVGGGGQTGDWGAYVKSPEYAADRAAFIAKWSGE